MSLPLIDPLKQRAQLLHKLRAFFYERQVMEVDAPVIGAHTVTDVFIEPLTTAVLDQTYYLQTSPEYFMKRLLAEGAGDIFSLGKAFRRDEKGRRHRPEFTMLEWYRIGFSDHVLMDEVQSLLLELSPASDVRRIAYGELFRSVLGCCPHAASIDDLHTLAHEQTSFIGELESKGAYLDLLFSLCVEPSMGRGITFVHNYPEVQSALAKKAYDEHGVRVARRFEVFWQGIELANGYWELTDPQEQRQRFANDLALRKKMGLSRPDVDHHFLAALDKGIPECAGVALGVDRLLMCLLQCDNIADVIPFS